MTYALNLLTLELQKLESEKLNLETGSAWMTAKNKQAYIAEYDQQISELKTAINKLQTDEPTFTD